MTVLRFFSVYSIKVVYKAMAVYSFRAAHTQGSLSSLLLIEGCLYVQAQVGLRNWPVCTLGVMPRYFESGERFAS